MAHVQGIRYACVLTTDGIFARKKVSSGKESKGGKNDRKVVRKTKDLLNGAARIQSDQRQIDLEMKRTIAYLADWAKVVIPDLSKYP